MSTLAPIKPDELGTIQPDEEENDEMASLPPGVFLDDLGRTMAPIDMLVGNPANPRDPNDFDPEKSPNFRDLLNSINQVGVREPIPVYREDLSDGSVKLRQKAGHRRKEAVRQINERRDEAYKALIEKGELQAGDPRPGHLERIEHLPVAIGEKPLSLFDEKADMFLAESLRLKWRLEKVLPFFKDTIADVPADLADDYEWLASRLGVPLARVKLLTTITRSQVLYGAATSESDKPLAKRGREKTLRSVIRAADVLFKYRPHVARKLTGRPMQDQETLEALRELVVDKASVVADQKRPAGVYFERLAPRMRDPEKHPDDELLNWGTGKIQVLEFPGAPTTVGSSLHPTTPSGDGLSSLADTVARYRKVSPSTLDDNELSDTLEEVAAAADALDELLASLRKERRARED
jgi:hypothetical protein